MPAASRTNTISRTRLCELAGIDRTRHTRWTKDGLLVEKDLYGELDLVRASALAQLVRVLKPKLARAVWHQIKDDINQLDFTRLDVIVFPATDKAWLVRTAEGLDEVLPRDRAVFVVSLAGPIAASRRRLHDFRAVDRGDAPAASPPIPLSLASEV